MIPNRKIPAVGKASYGRDFLFEKAVKTLVLQNKIVNLQQKL